MSFDKVIQHGKEHRKQYHGSMAFDRSCRNHGSCGWCKQNRLHNTQKRLAQADYDLNEYYELRYKMFGPWCIPEHEIWEYLD